MAHTKVLLREDVDDLGARGEIVRVRAGYARNYLLPRNLAVEATAVNASHNHLAGRVEARLGSLPSSEPTHDVVLANLMFGLPAVAWSRTARDGGHLWLAEVVATSGLVLLIAALTRSGRTAAAPVAVGAYIGAAYWFTSSTSFANPAVTIGRAFTDTFAGIAPTSVPGFVAAQLLGGLVAVAAITWWYPSTSRTPNRRSKATASRTPASVPKPSRSEWSRSSARGSVARTYWIARPT